MISNTNKKFIKSLQQKKIREEHSLFVVEGEKNILEMLDSDFEIEEIYVTQSFADTHKNKLTGRFYTICKQSDIESISSFRTNNAGIMVVAQKENTVLQQEGNEIVLVLDTISDPGNLGTIIRICDWYGIKKVILSKNTVELYNPKVIASTMGSIKRVEVFRTDLVEYFSNIDISNTAIYGAFLSGENIHNGIDQKSGYIIIGNESHGISSEVEKFVNNKITIPRFGKAESLNAGIATAIIIDNFMR